MSHKAPLNCVIIDDEPLARECIINYVNELDSLRIVGSGANPLELKDLLDKQDVDLIFLDIQMPIMTGIEFLKSVSNPPMVIITTAYPNYALEGFQLDVLDYLVKPITFESFFKAVTKAQDYSELLSHSRAGTKGEGEDASDYFFVKCEYKYERIYFEDILFIQGLQNYVTIHTREKKYMTLLSLKNVEENLSKRDFIRTHKSYVVSVSKIDAIEGNEIFVGSSKIPIGRNYRTEVLEKVVSSKLWTKSGENS